MAWAAFAAAERLSVSGFQFKYSKEEAWAYWSARLWLKTCAELGLGASLG